MKMDLMDGYYNRDGTVSLTVRSRTPYDMMDENVRWYYDNIRRDITHGWVKPDEGTFEDISWIETFYDFGQFISTYKPKWDRCSECGCYRLGFVNPRELSFKCFKCNISEKVFWSATNGDYDKPIVKKYLNEGVVDPAIEWKSYREIFDEEAKRIEEWYKAQLNSPIIPLSDIDKKNIVEKMINAANISTP